MPEPWDHHYPDPEQIASLPDDEAKCPNCGVTCFSPQIASLQAQLAAAQRWRITYIDYQAKFENDALTGAEDRAIADRYYLAAQNLNAALAQHAKGGEG